MKQAMCNIMACAFVNQDTKEVTFECPHCRVWLEHGVILGQCELKPASLGNMFDIPIWCPLPDK